MIIDDEKNVKRGLFPKRDERGGQRGTKTERQRKKEIER